MVLGVRKAFQRSGMTLPYVLISAYVFTPMVLMPDSVERLAGSGSSASEVGQGGQAADPLQLDGISVLNMTGPGFHNSSRFEQEIDRPNYFNYAQAVLPVDNPLISSHFGWRVAPCAGCSSNHKGVDFVPGAGKPVKAILGGIVAEAGYARSYGNWIKIEHIVPVTEDKAERWESIYAHLQHDSVPENVTVGAVVGRGQVLGAVGNTGISTGPHLHFELHIDGVATDPLPIISKSQVVKDFELVWR